MPPRSRAPRASAARDSGSEGIQPDQEKAWTATLATIKQSGPTSLFAGSAFAPSSVWLAFRGFSRRTRLRTQSCECVAMACPLTANPDKDSTSADARLADRDLYLDRRAIPTLSPDLTGPNVKYAALAGSQVTIDVFLVAMAMRRRH
jgi:hypothetical protein